MKITQIGRLQWYVSSESRKEMIHLVDFEPTEYEHFWEVEKDEPGAFQFSKSKRDKPGPEKWFLSRIVEEPTFCSCEAFHYLKHRPCKHQQAVISMLVDSIPLTGEQREELTARLEELCRQSPHWVGRETTEPEKPKPCTSIQTKRIYVLPKR